MKKLDISKLKNDLKKELDEFGKTYQDSSGTEWTKKINDILYKLAKSNGRSYYHASKYHKEEGANNPEWLYDYVWYTTNDNNTLENVYLIAESEWRSNQSKPKENYYQDIRYDFEKLLVSHVKFKLMIFEGNDSIEIEYFHKKLKGIIANCELTKNETDACYMFAAWNISKQEFQYEFVNCESK